MQYCVAQFPLTPAWPITQPVRVLMKVAEVARKFCGTGAAPGAVGVTVGVGVPFPVTAPEPMWL